MELISRQEAKAQGLKRYFTGEPCKYGHVSEQRVSNRCCCACERARQQTPDAVAKHAAWYAANKAQKAEKAQHYYANNKTRIRQRHKHYYASNKAAVRKQQQDAYAAPPDMKRDAVARAAAYDKANPDKAAYRVVLRISRKKRATPPWVDLEAIKQVYADCAAITQMLGEPHQVDHIYPLRGKTVCGLHVAANLQILTARENVIKSNSHPDEANQ